MSGADKVGRTSWTAKCAKINACSGRPAKRKANHSTSRRSGSSPTGSALRLRRDLTESAASSSMFRAFMSCTSLQCLSASIKPENQNQTKTRKPQKHPQRLTAQGPRTDESRPPARSAITSGAEASSAQNSARRAPKAGTLAPKCPCSHNEIKGQTVQQQAAG